MRGFAPSRHLEQSVQQCHLLRATANSVGLGGGTKSHFGRPLHKTWSNKTTLNVCNLAVISELSSKAAACQNPPRNLYFSTSVMEAVVMAMFLLIKECLLDQ
eukprot:3965227-Amphidinium_carterae.1